ncbi:hypothetical protein [Fluviispira vulneris]|uniref:hypothetical protein n=1 Tax=Fluviispira vulneris TaxID=2763012 RepID=UPI001644E947|nr:hypothetical protein [Fluviispira vulneris]
MLRIALATFLSLLLCACTLERKGLITITVVNSDQKKLPHTGLTLYEISADPKKERKLIQTATDSSGKVTWELNYSKIKEVKIVAKNENLETLYLPELKYLKSPSWWQEQDIEILITLKKIAFKENLTLLTKARNEKTLQPKETLLDFPDDPISQSIAISQIENNLSPEIIKPIPFNSILNTNIYKQMIFEPKDTEIKTNEKVTITENKNVLFDDSMSVEVYADGKPLENVQIYLGRNATQNVSFVGSTDMKGNIVIPMPKNRRGDMLYLKRNSYLTVAKPISSGSGRQKLRVDMLPGKSTEFLLNNYAYGFGRGMEKTELHFNSLKVDQSTMLGFVTMAKPFEDKSNISIVQKNAIPEKLEASFLKKNLDFYSLVNQIPVIFVSSLTPYKPSVGLIEPPLLGSLQTNMLWRRVRREFFSRFMNEFYMRGIIADDVQKMANSLDLSPLEMAKAGWKQAPFASDLDMIMSIQFKDENNKFTDIEGKVYDKSGRLISERIVPINESDGEKSAAKLFSFLSADLPIEGAIIKKAKTEVTINLGKNYNISVGDQFVAYIGKSTFSQPDKPVALIRVKSVNEKDSLAEIITGLDKIDKIDVIRITRYPEKWIQTELSKQIANTQ